MSNPSPTCEVKDGASAYVATANGVDVTPGATVVIRLASIADVEAWNITCISTDDTSSADTVTASLSIDADAKTATFTAPAPGKTYRFRSRVNSGVDVNGVARATYATTFTIHTRFNGRRVISFDETTEGDSSFGWTKWQNDLIRSLPSGVASGTWADFAAGGGGGGGDFQLYGANNHFITYQGGSAVGATGLNHVPTTGVVEVSRGLRVVGTAVATLANAMIVQGTAATGVHLVAPIVAGAVLGATTVYTGTASAAVGNARHRTFSEQVNRQTSTQSGVPIYAWVVADEAITSVFAEINAVPSGGGAGGSYGRRRRIWANGAVATCGSLDSVWSDEVTASGIGFTGISIGSGIEIGVSGMTGFVNIRGGVTATIDWGATITRTETTWA